MNSLKLVLGRYDDPENQNQDNYDVDLYTSNLAIIGSAMSGKTTLLKTLIVRLHQVVQTSAPEEIYILDFSNNLELYRTLPYVVAYFDALNDENVRRLFNVLEKKFYKNIKNLSGKSYVDLPDKSKIPHTTLILDGLNTFYTEDRYSAYQEILQKLARDGLSKGISIVFTANDNSGGINRLLQSFNRVIGFDLSKDKFSELFSGKIEKPAVLTKILSAAPFNHGGAIFRRRVGGIPGGQLPLLLSSAKGSSKSSGLWPGMLPVQRPEPLPRCIREPCC